MSFVTVQDLTKRFDKNTVINNISFSLEKGKCVSLLGPNGAGKTTTLRMLSGLMKPTKGSISIGGSDDVTDIRSFIGYLPQYPSFHNWMSGKEFLVHVGKLARLSRQDATNRADSLLEKVGLMDARNKRIGKYSGGMKQRLGIAQAMIHNPKLIMLDEPVSSLDPIGRREVLDLLEELKEETTILFSTHILSDAEEVSDELLLLHNGSIVESGSLASIQQKHESMKIDLIFSEDAASFENAIRDLESVDDLKRNGNHIEVHAVELNQARLELMKLAGAKEWPLAKFEVSKTSLEELFMKVVND